jgi:hypothetical protein
MNDNNDDEDIVTTILLATASALAVKLIWLLISHGVTFPDIAPIDYQPVMWMP